LLIGGGGRRVLSVAAREADIVGINPNLRAGEIGLDAAQDSLREQTNKKVQWIREAAGPRIDDIEIQMRFFITSVRPDRMKLAEALAPSFGVSPEEALESGAALVGTEDEIAEQLHRRRDEWGLSYVVVGDDNIDEFAPIVAKLTGT
jgi:alkanesulfonate monooxygenase SsuD/methylene tetrahydromethanopterin reductase-like flavin-dependent oxidoreductase (luciferase family)